MIGLLDMASAMEVTVGWEMFLPAGWMGAYSAMTHSISLLLGMDEVEERSVMAHELGHAHYRHGHSDRGVEWHADKWAAHHLIDKREFFLASKDRPSLEVLADRLNVTPHLASVYIRSFRAPGMFLDFQPVKLQLQAPTYKQVCALAA
ncbi:peptidase [Arthrobacter phage Sonali]|uniref:Peptidase n=1 Tax=Arthrobacter phage Sonali TaxID=2510495 RepID=A0A411CQU1_9CAUD|nr:metallo-protease [Arthrobacter phage Sonali]QAY16150.1 peptidase [Arthrobacter phage Sonali]